MAVLLLTPAQMEVSVINLVPSLFAFLFNVFFENDFSLRVLRPLALTLTSYLILCSFFLGIKRIFFSH